VICPDKGGTVNYWGDANGGAGGVSPRWVGSVVVILGFGFHSIR